LEEDPKLQKSVFGVYRSFFVLICIATFRIDDFIFLDDGNRKKPSIQSGAKLFSPKAASRFLIGIGFLKEKAENLSAKLGGSKSDFFMDFMVLGSKQIKN